MCDVKEMNRNTMLEALGHMYYGLLILHNDNVASVCLSRYLKKWNTHRPYEKIDRNDLEQCLMAISERESQGTNFH